MELQQVIQECGKQSITAQRYLFERYSRTMFIICKRYLRPDETAEDVLMIGFIKLFRSLRDFSYVNKIATEAWMRKIFLNECLMYLRSNTCFLTASSDKMPEQEMEEDITSQISAREIFEMITKLPAGYRAVFNMAVVENASHREIADVLGITESTSRTQLRRAKQYLQKLLINNNKDYAARRFR